jgi:type II secretory pathway component PulF
MNTFQKIDTFLPKISFSRFFDLFSSGTLSIKEQTFLIKRLSFLITAGVPIVESLTMIREQTRSKRQGKVLDSVITDVSNGQSLSHSFSKFKGMFSEFAINIIGVGESTGILSENLEYLADELKKKQILKRKIVGAFIYPIVVTCATLGITVFLMIYLFPKIMPVFTSLHMTLPLSTRIVIATSTALRLHGFFIFGELIVSIILLVLIVKKIPIIHFYFDRLLFKIPLIGNMIQDYNLASSMRTLGLLLKGGVTLSEALPIVVKTSQNLVYKKEFQSLAVVVNRGEKMSAYLKTKRKLFPDVVSQISTVGERSGNLSNSLLYLSDLYEGQVDDFTKNLSSLIEPVMMIVMGVLVGFIAISIITPIYSITQNLHP